MKVNKPPIGVKPHWFTYQERITELAQAINRYVDYANEKNTSIECTDITRTDGIYELISRWAFELSELSKLESKLLKRERGDEN